MRRIKIIQSLGYRKTKDDLLYKFLSILFLPALYGVLCL